MWFILSLEFAIGFDPLLYFYWRQRPIHNFSFYIIAESFWFCKREAEFFCCLRRRKGAPQRGALCAYATSWRFPRSSQEARAGILFSACGVSGLPAPENFALQNSPQRK
jgi:hypothetical protein